MSSTGTTLQKGTQMIIDKVHEDLKAAMKAKDTLKLSALRMLKSAEKNAAIEKRKEHVDDPEFLKLIAKLVKQRRESIEQFKKGNRNDLVEKEEAEIKILSAYLPDAMGEAELDQIVASAIEELGAANKSDMGKVMKLVMSKTAGRADGSLISKKVAAKLR